jgi:hypothetical protein
MKGGKARKRVESEKALNRDLDIPEKALVFPQLETIASDGSQIKLLFSTKRIPI